MRKEQKQRLGAAGWKVGSAEEFLQLTPEESAFIQVKLALADELKGSSEPQPWAEQET